MNNKVIGTIFMLLGVGLLGASTAELYQNAIGTDYESLKSVAGLVLGFASCIYGYKRGRS